MQYITSYKFHRQDGIQSLFCVKFSVDSIIAFVNQSLICPTR